jgi:S-adenosylmethionine decarboxylase
MKSVSSTSMQNDHPSVPYLEEKLSGFEGPEKKFEIDFTFIKPPTTKQEKLGLRNVSRTTWDKMLTLARCEIVGTLSNDHFDSYVLSESSLFIYPTKMMIKTCGTTTLLRTSEMILDIAKEHGLEVSFVCYSRKNFNFPDVQEAPHSSFEHEVAYLDEFFDGHGFTLGPMKGDHWNIYVADYNDDQFTLSQRPEVTIEILMHDLSEKKMKQFYKQENVTSADVTKIAGIDKLLKGSKIDDFQFEPCGYSMNGILDQFYSTIHVTPESHCSFVSYETNITEDALKKLGKTYTDLINEVVKCFEPKRFTVVLMADDHALTNENKTFGTVNQKCLQEDFKMKSKTFYEFDGAYNLTHASFVKTQ